MSRSDGGLAAEQGRALTLARQTVTHWWAVVAGSGARAVPVEVSRCAGVTWFGRLWWIGLDGSRRSDLRGRNRECAAEGWPQAWYDLDGRIAAGTRIHDGHYEPGSARGGDSS